MKQFFQKSFALVLFCSLSALIFRPLVPAFASTLDDLKSQQNYWNSKLAETKKKETEKAGQAERLKTQITIVNRDIDKTEDAMSATENQISQTEGKIEELSNQIKAEEESLSTEKEKLAAVVSKWYMEGSSGLLTAVIGSNNISEVATRQQYYDSVKRQIDISIERVTKIKNDLTQNKNDNANQLVSLQKLKEDQTNRKKSLENNKVLKDRLLNDTNAALVDLKDQEQQAAAKVKEIESRIKTLTERASWGNEIVSSGEGLAVPFITQIGNYTRLGDTPYAGINVNNYGCLITSMAMAASYFGHNVTPTGIANNGDIFSRSGYLLVDTPPGIGIRVEPSREVNRNVIDGELEANRPVIVSVYLPTVGSINNDGSSHFIVIKGRSGSKYLMNDPIGQGRGYNFSQLRSMKLVTPL